MNDPSDTYEDIINLPHHVSRIHPHMTLEERAAQFSPFAALTGYEAAIDKTRRKAQQELEAHGRKLHCRLAGDAGEHFQRILRGAQFDAYRRHR